MYDVVAINAASASTQLSGLPFSGPVGATRVALIDDQWVAFPTHEQLESAVFDMVVAGRIAGDDVAIMMVEAEATMAAWHLIKDEGKTAPTEEIVAAGLEAAKPFIKSLCEAQQQLAAQAAKPTAEFPRFLDYQDDAFEAVSNLVSDELSQALTIAAKQERETELDRIKDSAKEKLAGQFEGREKEISAAYRSVTKQLVRQRILRDKVRIDGRGLSDIRHALGRGRGAPAGARLGALRARRDPDPRRDHAEHAPHGADDRHAEPREPQALHAQLQLPALLHR